MKPTEKFHINTVFEVIKNQSQYLPTQTERLIRDFNQMYEKATELVKSDNPKCFVLQNDGQNNFSITLGVLSQEDELTFFYDDFDFSYNDEKSFGLFEYEMEIAEHPTEDLFSVFRSELLEKTFYIWILEGVWKSKLMELPVPVIYSESIDCDILYNTKDGWIQYNDFTFLEDN